MSDLRKEVARVVGQIQRRDNHDELMMVADAAIAIALERAAGVAEAIEASLPITADIAAEIRALAERNL